MITVRPGHERGRTKLDWLDSRHTFSFGDYHDPSHMGFRQLRVLNDDVVLPGKGFGSHSHRDMEILTLVLAGALEHKDSTGVTSVIRPGDVQRMSAGTGITHSEFNHSSDDPVHFLQIWILPHTRGLPPGYEQKRIPAEARRGRSVLLASGDGRDGSVTVHQEVRVFGVNLDPEQRVVHGIPPGRHAWAHVARGAVTLGGRTLQSGDGVAVSGEGSIAISGLAASGAGTHQGPADPTAEVLIFCMG
jgi:quercetin 2,3-dioxygenase